tara:strand:+ start:6253 stop:7344 length:1092 start_codon:yes stop_codon:yes gene_type:complete
MAYTPIDNPQEHFKPVGYVGNDTEPRNIDVGFQSDFTWVKDYTIAYYHRLFDSTRGNVGPLYPSEDNKQDHFNDGPEIDFSSPYSNGFKIIDNPDGTTNSYGVNANNSNIISWNWKLNGGTTSTNTDGDITSTVQANTDAGISIITYTGNGSTSQTVGHGLGAEPYVIMSKDVLSTSNVPGWRLYHKVVGNNKYMELQDDGGQSTFDDWGNTTPTSSVYTVGGSGGYRPTNTNATAYVAYCFTPKQGYSRFAFFRGNGSTDGPFVYTGFKPAFVMFKQYTANGNSWFMFDNVRSTVNGDMPFLRADGTNTQSGAGSDLFQFFSNGFKLKHNDSAFNGNNHDYLYWAFAENPFVTSGGAPTTAR